MMIESLEFLPENIKNIISSGHGKYEASHGIICNYKPFYFLAKDKSGELLGALQGYSAFSEIYIDDLWVDSSQRGKGIGRILMTKLEENFTGKGFNNINLVTSAFQAVEFYKKCGYEVEFFRKNKKNPKLSKTFFIKYLDKENQHQGLLKSKR